MGELLVTVQAVGELLPGASYFFGYLGDSPFGVCLPQFPQLLNHRGFNLAHILGLVKSGDGDLTE